MGGLDLHLQNPLASAGIRCLYTWGAHGGADFDRHSVSTAVTSKTATHEVRAGTWMS